MNKIVFKYGGSSVATIEKINQIAERLINHKSLGKKVVCVVSAMGGTTDELIKMTEEITTRPNGREMDMLISTGEQISASLLAMAIQSKGEKSVAFTGFQAGFKTSGRHTDNRIEDVDVSRIERALEDDKIVIITGFQGLNEKGDITTLGRGGSDTSAVALAAKLNAPCHILTDVKGIYTVDPRIYNKAKKIDYLSYEETLEMAYLGARVLEPRSVAIAKKYGVKLYVGLNTEDVVGTYIVEEGDIMERKAVSNVSITDDVLLVNMRVCSGSFDDITDIFTDLADEGVNVDVISQNTRSNESQYVSFTSDVKTKQEVEDVLLRYNVSYKFIKGVTKISVVGSGMRTQPGVAAEVFRVFSDNNIRFYQVSTSEISISHIIDAEEKEKIVRILAEKFEL